ncbi:MAG: DUF4347 domain-containing protein, partial [Planctomycetales bacterium]|nr:DUF4347 domain-containing protein [Planctomycetales bacterium]
MLRQARFIAEEMFGRVRDLAAAPRQGEPSGVELCQLEARILMSASPLAVLPEAPAVDVDEAVAVNEAEAQQQAATEPAVTEQREIVFLDDSIPDVDSLLADLQAEQGQGRKVDIFRLDATQDGIQQISQILAERDNISAVHLVSHAEEGRVRLGSTQLTADSLRGYAGEISQWATALTSDADLLFYGCNLAGNASGQELLESLAALTGADVAASTDNTGHAILGGDWKLEYSTGAIEAQLAFSLDVQAEWGHLMNVSVDATTTGVAAESSAGETLTHTTAGTDRLMLVGISFGEDDDQYVSSVTYNGTALSLVGAQDHPDSNKSRIEIWALVAPDVGTHNLVVGFSDTDHHGATIGVMTFNGVDQQTALGTFAASTGKSTTASTTVNSAVGDIVFGVVAFDDNNDRALDPGSGQSEQWELHVDDTNGAGSLQAGAATVTTSWTTSGNSEKWVVGGVSIKSAGRLTATGEFLVNTYTNDTQETSATSRGSAQAVAMAANGDYVVVWSSNNQSSGWDVFGQRFNAQGATQGDEFQVNQTSSRDQLYATVGMDASGNFVVAWTQEDSFGGRDVFAQRFNNLGVRQGIAFQVNDGSLLPRQNASIDVAADGRFVIAWQAFGTFDAGDIYARRFDAAGNALDTSDLAVETASGGDYDPVVSINDSGDFAVAWDDGGGVHIQRFNSNGTTRGGQITADTDNDAGNPALALNNDGSLVVVWRQGPSQRDVMLRRYDNSGNDLGLEAIVSTTTNSKQTDASIAMATNGDFIITWEGNGEEVGHTDTSGVFGQKYSADGNKVGSEFLINQSLDGNQHKASLAMLDLDNFVVVWSGAGTQTGQLDTSGVFARQFGTAAGGGLPTAHSGGPYIINQGDALNLDGSGSSDPLTRPLTYRWDLNGNGTYGEAGEPSTETPVISWSTLVSLNVKHAGTYVIGLQVDNGFGGVNTASSSLTIGNVAPTLTSATTVSMAENSTAVQTVTATDPGESVSFSLSGGVDQNLFQIVAGTGALSFKVAPNFEDPQDTDRNNVYHVEVSASDGRGGSRSQVISVTVNNANDSPSGLPTIVGSVALGQTLTADTTSISDADGLG